MALDDSILALVREITKLRDDVYNAAVISNPEPFALALPRTGARAAGPSSTDVREATAPIQLYQNESENPVMVYARAESPGGESVGLFLALDDALATQAKAPLAAFGSKAALALLLRPGDRVWAAITASVAINVVYTVIPLRGRVMLGFAGAQASHLSSSARGDR